MNIEIIMAVLYVACLLSGSSWILLSDITRYYFESHLPLFYRLSCIAEILLFNSFDNIFMFLQLFQVVS